MSVHLFRTLRTIPHDTRQFGQGTLLFAQGDKVQMLYLIESGNVQLVRNLIDGFSLTLHRAGVGAILAEASLFSESYHCDAIAIQSTRAFCLPKSKVRVAMARDPELMQAWAEFLAHEVQASRFRAEILALRTVAERLDAWLASQGGQMPKKGGWKSVAAQIGVSAEALYRELARRRQAG